MAEIHSKKSQIDFFRQRKRSHDSRAKAFDHRISGLKACEDLTDKDNFVVQSTLFEDTLFKMEIRTITSSLTMLES